MSTSKQLTDEEGFEYTAAYVQKLTKAKLRVVVDELNRDLYAEQSQSNIKAGQIHQLNEVISKMQVNLNKMQRRADDLLSIAVHLTGQR